MEKYVFMFSETKEGNTEKAQFVLGNKGAQLSEMTTLGLPVPSGFTITTGACREYYTAGKKWPNGLEEQVKKKLAELEKKMEKQLGKGGNPLFVSVRSGSYVSMPGMMDTVLNLGMNDESVVAFAKKTNERAAWDSYRRFINMFGDVVMEISHSKFEEVLDRVKKEKGVKLDTELNAADLKKVVDGYKKLVQKEKGKSFPQDAWQQLRMSIDAVFGSWNSARAVAYRRINKLRDDAGTAVNVQAMVFGNMGDESGTGVSFTRNPATGKKEHYGEFLQNAQGEDVVAGIRTPRPVDELKKVSPKVYADLLKIYEKLEKHYRDLQDFEFTYEDGKLYMLQTRAGKRTGKAAVKIAVDMVKEGLISREEAVMRVDPKQLDQLLHKQIDPAEKKKAALLGKGIDASPGAAVGKVVFTAEEAKEMVEKNPNEKLILVRNETSPEDIEGMNAAAGILTARGGSTSHASVVARGMGKPCVAGCSDLSINEKAGTFTARGNTVKEGDVITIDGSTGEVFFGEMKLIEPEMSGDFGTLMQWADSVRRLGVRTNADTPNDAKIARNFGAEGIGLCRTEHMFFEEKRIMAVREMILAADEKGRRRALEKILPFQRDDFIGIFEAMTGLPVTIRLLDPPLHEFLPTGDKEISALAVDMKISEEMLRSKIESMKEINPMLGFRGVRLGIVYPEINETQVRAIFEAAIEVNKGGKNAVPEIMIPVVGKMEEMKIMKELIDRIGKQVMEEKKAKVAYKTGVMMELPRACLTADEIAEHAEFFSFGTNDLTQTTYGYSRDDAGKFIPAYIEKGLMKDDPFQVLDRVGVGELIRISVEKGRKVRKDLKIGICGEHGGEPSSVEFCHSEGLNYVSCSPFRVPIARLAAARAALKEKSAGKKGKAAAIKKK